MKKENYFEGEHIESYGNQWKALSVNIEQYLPEVVSQTLCKPEGAFYKEIENLKYLSASYQNDSPVSIRSLIEISENSLVSIYPVFKGIDNKLILKDQYSWAIKAEGEMAAETEFVEGLMLNFHNPYFIVDAPNFEFNKVQIVALAGLAYSIEKLEEQEFKIEEGPSYNFFLKEFLKENPNKTKADFEPPVHKLDADHFRMMISREYTSLYEASGQIKEINNTNIFNQNITILKVDFAHEEEGEPLYINIYVSDSVLNGYKPKVGDGIVSILWLTGYFN